MLLFCALGLLLPTRLTAGTFVFSVGGGGSSIEGTLDLSAATSGSLVGDFDPVENPDGTRTKPGLFGSFGSTENVAVPVELTPGLSSPLESTPSGGFVLEVNPEVGTVVLSGLTLDLLSGGPLVIPSQLSLEFSTFRTRSPDSLFIGGFPIAIPLGESRLTALAAAQIGSAAGDLVVVGVDMWDFNVSVLVQVSGDFEGLAGQTPVPPVPVPLTLAGRARLTDQGAEVAASSSFDFGTTTDLASDLPTVPFALPTILPAGNTANVLFDLTLESIGIELASTLTLAAVGVPVPEPGAVGLGIAGFFWVMSRRRRG